jgi:hypothetical protein
MKLMIKRMDENGKQIVHVTGLVLISMRFFWAGYLDLTSKYPAQKNLIEIRLVHVCTGILLETEMNMQYFLFQKMKHRGIFVSAT